MQPHEELVVQERDELADKLVKLSTFILKSDTFRALSDDDKQLLRLQRDTMLEYHEILEDRIAGFDPFDA